MNVLITWSGERSKAAAIALREWLPQLVNAIEPWMSSEDIRKGSRWDLEIAGKLETAKAGIVCLTRSNLHAEWIHFESGALAKSVHSAHVCTSARPDQQLVAAFDMWWPILEKKLNQLPEDTTAARPVRKEREILEEILELLRAQGRPRPPLAPMPLDIEPLIPSSLTFEPPLASSVKSSFARHVIEVIRAINSQLTVSVAEHNSVTGPYFTFRVFAPDGR